MPLIHTWDGVSVASVFKINFLNQWLTVLAEKHLLAKEITNDQNTTNISESPSDLFGLKLPITNQRNQNQAATFNFADEISQFVNI